MRYIDIMSVNPIYNFLEKNDISFEKFEHPAVYTCEEAEALCPDMPGTSTKNLFLYDSRAGKYFLVIVGYEKRVDLKALQPILGAKKITFGSPEKLKEMLGVEPGSVTLLGLFNDQQNQVQAFFDEEIWQQDLQCHPLVNTATLVIPFEGVKKFLEASGHEYHVIKVPNRI